MQSTTPCKKTSSAQGTGAEPGVGQIEPSAQFKRVRVGQHVTGCLDLMGRSTELRATGRSLPLLSAGRTASKARLDIGNTSRVEAGNLMQLPRPHQHGQLAFDLAKGVLAALSAEARARPLGDGPSGARQPAVAATGLAPLPAPMFEQHSDFGVKRNPSVKYGVRHARWHGVGGQRGSKALIHALEIAQIRDAGSTTFAEELVVAGNQIRIVI